MYKLDNRRNKKKYDCPACGHKRTWTLYIHAETGNELNPIVGKCDRENNCSHHYTPGQFFKDHPDKSVRDYDFKAFQKPEPKPTSYISKDIFLNSIVDDFQEHPNYFLKYLMRLFGEHNASMLAVRYNLGTSAHWKGSVVFWQMDIEMKFRTGKIMLYDPETGKRVKKPFNHIHWIHALLEDQKEVENFHLTQCFFGEHLLKFNPGLKVAIVESEKTAIIASVYFPEFIWLASGSLVNISVEKCKVLKGRLVILFPDLKGLEKWKEKAKEIRQKLGLNIIVFEWLEKSAEKANLQNGYDLADFLVCTNDKGQALDDNGIPLSEILKLVFSNPGLG